MEENFSKIQFSSCWHAISKLSNCTETNDSFYTDRMRNHECLIYYANV